MTLAFCTVKRWIFNLEESYLRKWVPYLSVVFLFTKKCISYGKIHFFGAYKFSSILSPSHLIVSPLHSVRIVFRLCRLTLMGRPWWINEGREWGDESRRHDVITGEVEDAWGSDVWGGGWGWIEVTSSSQRAWEECYPAFYHWYDTVLGTAFLVNSISYCQLGLR